MNHSRNQYIIYAILVLLSGALVYALMNNREPETRFGSAMEELGDGVEGAARELDPDRSPGEKFGDAVEDLGEGIEDATDGK